MCSVQFGKGTRANIFVYRMDSRGLRFKIEYFLNLFIDDTQTPKAREMP